MRGTVIVDDQRTFEAWLSKQQTFAPARAETHGNVTKGG
jgi:heme/copper-type cytochrome/quinol oxidase subunit 2